jgi:hypothetical protein
MAFDSHEEVTVWLHDKYGVVDVTTENMAPGGISSDALYYLEKAQFRTAPSWVRCRLPIKRLIELGRGTTCHRLDNSAKLG